MTNQFKFNASSVICNNYSENSINDVNPDHVSLLSSFINTHFMMNSIDVILDELIETGIADPDQGYCIGSSCSNTNHLITRMLTGLLDYGTLKLGNYELSTMWVNAQLELMTASNIITILKSAIISAASQDHYDEFEAAKY